MNKAKLLFDPIVSFSFFFLHSFVSLLSCFVAPFLIPLLCYFFSPFFVAPLLRPLFHCSLVSLLITTMTCCETLANYSMIFI
jgi:hypothetical protein